MEYDLFLGCVIPARLPFLEASSRLIFEKMGIKLKDVDGFSCCPDPTGIEQIDHDTWMTLGARNLSLSNNGNGGIISFCSGCVETLKGVNYSFNKEKKLQTKINGYLKKVGKNYDGSTNVKHFGEVLYENLDLVKENIVNPLNGFKVAVHYGCHYLRPSEIINWDDPFEPTTIDTIVHTLGAETIDYDLKLECCGNPVEKSDKDLSLLMIENKLNSIIDSGANCVALVCPACYQQFDFNQHELNKRNEREYSISIFYLSELIGLAFGISPKEMGLKYHRVKPDNLFQTIKFEN
jgi:heterodisulfide reductase subunit B